MRVSLRGPDKLSSYPSKNICLTQSMALRSHHPQDLHVRLMVLQVSTEQTTLDTTHLDGRPDPAQTYPLSAPHLIAKRRRYERDLIADLMKHNVSTKTCT